MIFIVMRKFAARGDTYEKLRDAGDIYFEPGTLRIMDIEDNKPEIH